MRRETQNVLLVLVGGALLKISLTGTYLLYVKPSHRYWLIAGGTVMLVLAAVSIFRDIRATSPAGQRFREDEHPDETTHEHQHSARSAWLLVLPVLAIFLIAPPALGADSVRRADNGAAVARSATPDSGMDSAIYPALPQADVLPIGVGDFSSRAAFDRSHALDGRVVRLTGFIVQDGDKIFLARITIACCAADAFPVRVRLDGRAASGLANDTWVDATGELEPGSATKENDYVPTLALTGVTRVPQPENPYEQ